MQREELVFLLSRTISVLLAVSAVLDASYLPERFFALSHHLFEGRALSRYDYWSSYYLVVTSFLVVRVLALLLGAQWFWKCGSGIQSIFEVPPPDERL